MRVLLLGAYGFIGSEIADALIWRDHAVVGLSRRGGGSDPRIEWITGDLNRMLSPADWRPLLIGIDAVINASGALQDGAGDRLERTQHRAIVALIEACEQADSPSFVQISAPGATAGCDTAFLRTKAAADARLMRSTLHWTILRPGLVIGRNAYGGTALIRMLAALPVQALVHGDAPIQCVGIEEVAGIAVEGAERALPSAIDLDLVAPRSHTLREVVVAHRRWLGLPPARAAIDLPAAVAAPIGLVADLAGLLGWRPPLRSTALRVIAKGVTADGTALARIGRLTLADLPTILARHRAGLQDRWGARLALLLPVIVLGLALLWTGSGIAGLLSTTAAADLIGGGPWARPTVRAFSIVDIVLGLAILIRATGRIAATAMAIVTIGYLVGGSVLAPALWLDPLGPLLKAVCVLILALVAHGLLERR